MLSNEIDQADLERSIETYVERTIGQTDAEEDTKKWVVKILTRSVIRRCMKFAKGQQEHGGDFLKNDLNVLTNLEEELDDSFFYLEKMKHQINK